MHFAQICNALTFLAIYPKQKQQALGLNMKNERMDAARINPLVGRDTADTIENLTTCLRTMGGTYSEKHKDETISFFCSIVAAALAFESCSIKSLPPHKEQQAKSAIYQAPLT